MQKTFLKRMLLIPAACCFLALGGSFRDAESKDAAMSLQIKTVTTDDFSMDFIHFGRGNRTLVILPGLSVDSVMKYAGTVADAYSIMTDDFPSICLIAEKNCRKNIR